MTGGCPKVAFLPNFEWTEGNDGYVIKKDGE